MTDLANWTPRARPGLKVLEGARVGLEPLDWKRHGEELFDAVAGPRNLDLWRWMPRGPYPTFGLFCDDLEAWRTGGGWETLIIRAAGSGEIMGMASFMRIRESHGSCEVGAVAFGETLKRTAAATEAMFLMARHVFEDLGYRRYEWKCNDDNRASHRAAARLGFVYEGTFRNDMVVKGKNRDTAWYSITDREWPAVKAALEAWLRAENFEPDGYQRQSLEAFRAGRAG